MFTVPPFSAFSRRLLASATLLLSVAAGCTYSHGEREATPQPCEVSAQSVTYSGVISPIFDAHCRECHGTSVYATKAPGVNFGDYQAINSYFSPSKLLGCIRHDPGFDPMPQGREKLSDCDIQRIEAWIAAGKKNN